MLARPRRRPACIAVAAVVALVLPFVLILSFGDPDDRPRFRAAGRAAAVHLLRARRNADRSQLSLIDHPPAHAVAIRTKELFRSVVPSLYSSLASYEGGGGAVTITAGCVFIEQDAEGGLSRMLVDPNASMVTLMDAMDYVESIGYEAVDTMESGEEYEFDDADRMVIPLVRKAGWA